MIIRAAANDDVEHLVCLFAQLGYAIGAAQLAQQLDTLQQRGDGPAFVADCDGALAGVAVVHVIAAIHVPAPWALLSALVIDETRRSAGIGAALLRAAEVFAIERGCSQMELSSSTRRTRAHAFYARHGYEEKRLRLLKILR